MSGSLASSVVTTVSQHMSSLSDTQLQRYGQYTLAAATVYYLAISLKKDVPADVQYAIDAHLPQGYDRSVIAARLEQRHAKKVLTECLRIHEIHEKLHTEKNREAKIHGWEMVLEKTLVGLLAGAYTHSLTLSLFTVKNTVRVLMFVLRRREDAGRDTNGKGGRGAMSKVKAWWSGGTRSVIMESLMERMTDQLDKQASPFANAGLDEETLPLPPIGGRDAFVYSQMIGRELSAAAADDDDYEDDDEDRGLGDDDDASNHNGRRGVTNNSCVSNSSTAWTSSAIAEAERLFCVKDIMSIAIPRIVSTATGVVRRVLARHQSRHSNHHQHHEEQQQQRDETASAHAPFSIPSSVTSRQMRWLLADLCDEMERSACVAEWIRAPAEGTRPAPSPRGASFSSVGDAVEAEQVTTASTTNGKPQHPQQRGKRCPSCSASDDDDSDIVHFPAGSTTMLGPDGRPIPKTGQAPSTFPVRGGATSDESYMNHIFGLDDVDQGGANAMSPSSSAEVRRLRREAMREELRVKQQTSGFFQELIHSASFNELCLQYAESILVGVMFLAMDLSTARTYDAATDSAKMLMIIPVLEGHRKRLHDTTEFEVPSSMRLFCEETVRSTCFHAGSIHRMDNSLRLWESLRTDVRQVDQVVDQQLSQLEDVANINEDTVQVASGGRSSSTPSGSHLNGSHGIHNGSNLTSNNGGAAAKPMKSLVEVQRQFDELRAGIDTNMRHYENQLQAMTDASAGSLTATKHTERFQGLYQERRRTLQRICNDFKRRREQMELLPSIAVDLRNYEDEAGTRLLMDEQNAIRHAHARVTNIIDQATSTHARLQNQRERFMHMGDKLVQIAERIPVIQTVLKRIDARRRKEVVILGTLLSLFIFATVIFW